MRSTMKRPDLPRPAVAGGALAAVGLLAFLLIRPSSQEAPLEAPDAAPAPLPPPVAPAPAAPAPAAPNANGLRLFGLLGRGAIIALPDGRQSFFAIDREVLPGLKVARIEQKHVVLASAGGELRLGFDGAAPIEPADPPANGQTRSEPRPNDDALTYRFGLEARRSNGRIDGYALRPGANLPLLEQAGLRAGDVILSVNGQTFDSDEKVLELPREIAGSFTAEFEYDRSGRRMRTSLQVNPRS